MMSIIGMRFGFEYSEIPPAFFFPDLLFDRLRDVQVQIAHHNTVRGERFLRCGERT